MEVAHFIKLLFNCTKILQEEDFLNLKVKDVKAEQWSFPPAETEVTFSSLYLYKRKKFRRCRSGIENSAAEPYPSLL